MKKKYTADDIQALNAKANLTVPEAAFYAAVDRAHLYHLWKTGEGPPTVTFGRRRIVPRAGLDAWLAARATTAFKPTCEIAPRKAKPKRVKRRMLKPAA